MVKSTMSSKSPFYNHVKATGLWDAGWFVQVVCVRTVLFFSIPYVRFNFIDIITQYAQCQILHILKAFLVPREL